MVSVCGCSEVRANNVCVAVVSTAVVSPRSCTAMASSPWGWFSSKRGWTDDSWEQQQEHHHHQEKSQSHWQQSDAGSWGNGNSSSSSSSSGRWPDSQPASTIGTECKFKNCTTLGEKHPLPLDERKDLLLALFSKFVNLLQELANGPGHIQALPRVAVGCWGATAVQAAFFLLCRVQPSFVLRPLKNPSGQMYETQYAATVLSEMIPHVYKTQEDMKEMWDFLLQHCWGLDQEAIINKAETLGFDFTQVSDKLAAGPGRNDSRHGLPNSAFAPARRSCGAPPVLGGQARQLTRMTTDEELEYLCKRRKTIELRLAVQQQEMLLVKAESGTAQQASREQED